MKCVAVMPTETKCTFECTILFTSAANMPVTHNEACQYDSHRSKLARTLGAFFRGATIHADPLAASQAPVAVRKVVASVLAWRPGHASQPIYTGGNYLEGPEISLRTIPSTFVSCSKHIIVFEEELYVVLSRFQRIELLYPLDLVLQTYVYGARHAAPRIYTGKIYSGIDSTLYIKSLASDKLISAL